MSSNSLHGVDASDLHLVRVQRSIADCRVNESGDLVFSRSGSGRKEEMNTFHFALNGVVSDHVYAAFDGGIVIIAPLVPTCVDKGNLPSGLTAVDTWFHADAQHEMTLAGTIILASDGFDVPTELRDRTQFYGPGLREVAAEAALAALGAPTFKVGMHSWQGVGFPDLSEHNALASALGAPNLPAFSHANSPDEAFSLGEAALNIAISDAFAGEVLHANSSGLEVPMAEHCTSLLKGIRDTAAWHADLVGDARATEFFGKRISIMEARVEHTVGFWLRRMLSHWNHWRRRPIRLHAIHRCLLRCRPRNRQRT